MSGLSASNSLTKETRMCTKEWAAFLIILRAFTSLVVMSTLLIWATTTLSQSHRRVTHMPVCLACVYLHFLNPRGESVDEKDFAESVKEFDSLQTVSSNPIMDWEISLSLLFPFVLLANIGAGCTAACTAGCTAGCRKGLSPNSTAILYYIDPKCISSLRFKSQYIHLNIFWF